MSLPKATPIRANSVRSSWEVRFPGTPTKPGAIYMVYTYPNSDHIFIQRWTPPAKFRTISELVGSRIAPQIREAIRLCNEEAKKPFETPMEHLLNNATAAAKLVSRSSRDIYLDGRSWPARNGNKMNGLQRTLERDLKGLGIPEQKARALALLWWRNNVRFEEAK